MHDTAPLTTSAGTGSARSRSSRAGDRVRRRRGRVVVAASLVLGVTLLLARLWSRLHPAGVFAEDGLVFYLQAQEIGAGAVWRPYAGYLHLVPRLGAALVSPWGLPAVPVAYAVYSLVVTAGAFSLVLSRRMERLIPTAWGRGLAFVVLCLVPQFWETATVVASLIFVGSVALLVLGLSRAPRTTWGRVAELTAVALLGLSGPLVVFFSPVFAYRWWRDRRRYNAVLAGVVAVTAATELAVFAHSGRVAATYTFERLPSAYLQRIPGELLSSRTEAMSQLDSGGLLRSIAVLWLLAVVALIALELGGRGLVALAVTVFAFAWAVRTYDIILMDPTLGDRHVFVPSAVLLLLLVAGLASAVVRARRGSPRRRLHLTAAVVGVVALLMTVPGIGAGFQIPAYSRVPSPQELAAFQQCMDRGTRECSPVSIAPEDFFINPNHPWDPDPY